MAGGAFWRVIPFVLGAAGVAALASGVRGRKRLDGQVVLITGGSRGLGLELARAFAERGCRVAICARDDRELARARRDLAARGADVLAMRCDVSDPGSAEGLVHAVEERFGAVDVLVNNAGVIQMGPVSTMTAQDFRAAADANFLGAVQVTLAALPGMRRRGRGRIVNVTSVGGKVPIPFFLPYAASKAAFRMFSDGLRIELRPEGIPVTTVVPWLMRTGSPPNAWFKGRRELEWTLFSLGDALPLLSVGSRRAALRIVGAAERGRRVVPVGWQAWAASVALDLLPRTTEGALSLVARLLPRAVSGDTRAMRGMDLATPLSPSPLTALMNRAARRNNEYGGRPQPSPRHARQAGLELRPEA